MRTVRGLGPSEDDRQFGRAADAFDVGDEFELSLEDVAVEKEERAEGLILSGGGDGTIDGEMAQEGSDFAFTHHVRMAFAMEEDEAANPIEVSLLGAQAVVLHAQMPADTVEEFWTGRSCERSGGDHEAGKDYLKRGR